MTAERQELVYEAVGIAERLQKNIAKTIFGKDYEIKLVLVPFLCKQHVYEEDVPGTGKTTLAKALMRSIHGVEVSRTTDEQLEGVTFGRIQGLADLMPQDVTGWSIYNPATNQWEFHAGPIFTNILLVDEINRASPRGIQGLLEAMAERHVTIEGAEHALPDPFFIMATANPVEFAATYQMGEAMLDRFMLQTEIGYPDEDAELAIVRAQRGGLHPLQQIEPELDLEEVRKLQSAVNKVVIDPFIERWIVKLVQETRNRERYGKKIRLPVSPRGSERMDQAVRAWALIQGETCVWPEFVEELLLPVLRHRLVFDPDYSQRFDNERVATETFLKECVEAVPFSSMR